ncbi:hypothetical protein CC2G_003873 [Coprinopsis cinerea AmutBmut pab1-1]|nr:hypothetical protein CC2G_003873 [Coprinopsis cinerea AmutBmut pab1-1]
MHRHLQPPNSLQLALHPPDFARVLSEKFTIQSCICICRDRLLTEGTILASTMSAHGHRTSILSSGTAAMIERRARGRLQ